MNENNETSLKTETDDTANLSTSPGNAETPQPNGLAEINQTLAALQDLFEKQIARNQNQTEMFDKMYAEMKDYKESFLLEVLHKPIIHNLIQLYDSFLSIESQLDDILIGKENNILTDELSQYRQNLENFRYKLEEVLYRMDVTPYKDSPETLDRQLHKTRKVISSDDPKQDQKVAEIHKIGFNWRDKVFRPEEVTIFRYTPSAGEPPLNKKEDNTNG
ncbi:nucleotide exchange factor GrpE [Candidatus Poribacteria bacterium]|nr:nucleotide exchange factor GrpE [Candidatus Poribacteria bacterium]